MTPRVPTPEDALRLFRSRFLNRTDVISICAPWGKPCPIYPSGTLDDLLLGHVFGDGVPPTSITYRNRRGAGAMRGCFRVGSYCPGLDDTTRWLCIDFDGPGHADPLADPEGTAVNALLAFDTAGLAAYLERSGSGMGWHVWCFFDPPLVASKARELGYALAPKNALLAGRPGVLADPHLARGIEVFPKQDRLRRGGRKGLGSPVWLPWWSGAPDGGNAFYRRGENGQLERYVPAELSVAAPEAIQRVLASRQMSRRSPRVGTSASRPRQDCGPDDAAWAAWRRRAIAALPLDAVYGPWLTGNAAGAGWLECRDPASPTGDQRPSAGVADGSGEAERGSFHSFISGATLSVFDFLVAHGGSINFRAARQRVADLAGIPEPSFGAEVSRSATATSSSSARPPRKLRIFIRPDEHAVVDEAIDALGRVDGVYQRGPLLVHVVKHDGPLAGVIHPIGAPRIFALATAGIRDRLTLAADWIEVKESSHGTLERATHPPTWLPPEIEARKHWPAVPHLEGVIDSPILRPDGMLLERSGYDASTGLLLVPNARYPSISATPPRADAAAAAAELLDLVVDFPFKSDAHRAAWLAAVLTPLARFAFRGPSPLFVMDANVPGAGKTLLVDLIGEIVSGRELARTPQTPDETEEIKRITAIALDGTRLVLIDNISRPLGSSALDAVLTGTAWSERILGRSERVDLPLLTVWYASGNNVTFKGDTARRSLHVRLDSDLEKPELRNDFKRPALLAWTHENRPRLVMAALTILRAYCAAGRPAMPVKSWGSFEGWSGLVRNAIVWAGLADPGTTRAELDDIDANSSSLAELLTGWNELPHNWGTTGCSAARALEVLHDDATGRRYPRLRAALGELCPTPSGQLPTPRRVGYVLRRFRGRVANGRKLQTRVLEGNQLWFVQQLREATTDPAGTSPHTQLSLVVRDPGAEDPADDRSPKR